MTGPKDADRPCWLTIADAARLLRRRELSPVELTRSVLDRIAETEGRIHAYALVLGEEAMAAARDVEAAIGRGEYRGPLHGIPVALKDLYYVSGIRTEAGSKVLAGFVPSYDSTVAARLREAGAILVGKTVTHEFAYGQNIPPTRNPWDLERTPGGSSAGSGASVAAGSCLAAMGTDTGGSIRMPASVNGIVGLKPTFGRVGRHGVVPLSWSLDHCGPMARTVEDVALVLGAIAGLDPLDPAGADEPVPDYASEMRRGVEGLRLGVPTTFFLRGVHGPVKDAVAEAVRTLEGLGATVVKVEIPHMERAAQIGLGILLPEASAFHETWLRQRAKEYDEGTRTILEVGALLPATGYVRALRARSVIKAAFRDVFVTHRLDALITPTEPTTATRIDQTSVRFEDVGEEPFFSVFVRETIPFNLAGLPALSVPCGFSPSTGDPTIGPSLPIGLHIAGRPFDESAVLRVGYSYQRVTDWHTRRPPL